MLIAPSTERALTRGSRPAVEAVLGKLRGLAALSAADVLLVRGLSALREQHAVGAEVCAEGAALRPRVILSGWAARMRLLPDGRRQIFSLLVPGDGLGLCPRPQPLGLSACVALTRLETADAAMLRDAADDPASGLGLACARAACLEEAQVLDHVMRLGRQTALERTAHLFLELRWRLAAVGLAAESRFPLPLTQEVLADALGLSIVHVNRTLQQLRREGLIEMKSGWVELLDREGLSELADFAPPAVPRPLPERRSFAVGLHA